MFKHLIPISVILLTLLACGGNKTKQPNIEVTVESKRYEVITNIQFHDIIRQKMEHIQTSQSDLIKELNTINQTSENNENQLSLFDLPENKNNLNNHFKNQDLNNTDFQDLIDFKLLNPMSHALYMIDLT